MSQEIFIPRVFISKWRYTLLRPPTTNDSVLCLVFVSNFFWLRFGSKYTIKCCVCFFSAFFSSPSSKQSRTNKHELIYFKGQIALNCMLFWICITIAQHKNRACTVCTRFGVLCSADWARIGNGNGQECAQLHTMWIRHRMHTVGVPCLFCALILLYWIMHGMNKQIPFFVLAFHLWRCLPSVSFYFHMFIVAHTQWQERYSSEHLCRDITTNWIWRCSRMLCFYNFQSFSPQRIEQIRTNELILSVEHNIPAQHERDELLINFWIEEEIIKRSSRIFSMHFGI